MGRNHGRAEPEPPPFPIGWVQGSAPRWVVWGSDTTQQLSKSLANPLLSGSAGDRETFVQAAWEGWYSSQSVGERDKPEILQMLEWFEGVVDKLCYVGALSFTNEIMAQIPGKVVKRRGYNAVIATKMSHLQAFFNDFPKMACPSTSYEAYERLHELTPSSLRKWKERCVIEDWPSWTESARRRYSFAPQYVRDLLGLPRLGRNFDKYYPPAVVQKTQAYVRKQHNPEGPSKSVSLKDLQATMGGLVQEENKKVLLKFRHANPGKSDGDCPLYKGTGSIKAVRRVSADMGLTNRATKISSNELEYDSKEMVAFRALVRKEANETVMELVGNMDEMWRRQMRDDHTRSLHVSAQHEVDTSVANPKITIEPDAPQSSNFRVVATADFGSWRGPLRQCESACQRDARSAERLLVQGATYRDFDSWQKQIQGNNRLRRRKGIKKIDLQRTKTPRSAAPPGQSHKKGKTIITFIFASGHRGPTVTQYSKSYLTVKAAMELNDLYAPEHIFHNTTRRTRFLG